MKKYKKYENIIFIGGISFVILLAIAIIVAVNLNEKKRTQISEEVFYGGTGTKISDIADEYSDYTDGLKKQVESYSSYGDYLDESSDVSETKSRENENILFKIKSITESLKNKKITANKALNDLESLIESYFENKSDIQNNTYFAVLFGAASLGGSDELMDTANQNFEENIKKIKEQKADFERIKENVNKGVISNDECAAQIIEFCESIARYEGIISDYIVNIVSTEKHIDDSNNAFLIVTYLWKNKSNKSMSFRTAFDTIAFQNNIECKPVYGVVGVDTTSNYTYINPDTELEVKSIYPLNDESNVTIEISDATGIDDTVITKTFAVK